MKSHLVTLREPELLHLKEILSLKLFLSTILSFLTLTIKKVAGNYFVENPSVWVCPQVYSVFVGILQK